jgi:hypothetical protein
MFAVATGNAFDGLTLHGPFTDINEAEEWLTAIQPLDWTIVAINQPGKNG